MAFCTLIYCVCLCKVLLALFANVPIISKLESVNRINAAQELPIVFLLFHVASALQLEKNRDVTLQTLCSIVGTHSHLALATCKSSFEFPDKNWSRRLPCAFTRWTMPNEDFKNLIHDNIFALVKTTVIFPIRHNNKCACVPMFHQGRSSSLVDWIVLHGEEARNNTGNCRMHLTGAKQCSCSHRDQGAGSVNPKPSAMPPCDSFMSVYSQDCQSVFRGHDSGVQLARSLRNQVVRVGCYSRQITRESSPCSHRPVLKIQDALRVYNATPQIKVYTNFRDVITDFERSLVDIIMEVGVTNEDGPRLYLVPPPLAYSYETFYSYEGQYQPVSLFDVLTKSHFTILLVIASLLASLLALGLVDFDEFRHGTAGYKADTLMFLIAPLYATASVLPRSKRWLTRRTLVYVAWFLGAVPLTTYFRSELTSQLSARRPPDRIDTLRELENALDRRQVWPCLVEGTATHTELIINASGSNIHAKLRAAFMRAQASKPALTKDPEECFTCANGPDRVCVLNKFPSCYVTAVAPGVLESSERLRPIMAVTPTRRGFRFASAYVDLLHRILEAPFRTPHKFELLCELRAAATRSTNENLFSAGYIEEFDLFFKYFGGLLGIAVMVFIVEVLFAAFR